MSTYPQILVNGVNLSDTNGRWALDRDQVLRGLPSRRATSITAPGRDGAIRPGGRESLDVVQFPISLLVMGHGATTDAQIADLERNLDALKALLTQNTVTLTLYTAAAVTTDSSVRVTAEARCLSADVQYVQAGDRVNAKMAVIMEMTDPYWRDEDYHESLVDSTMLAVPHVLTELGGSTGPIPDAQFRISGPFQSIRILDAGSGQNILIGQPLASGQYLLIDCSTFTAGLVTQGSWDTSTITEDWTHYIQNLGPGSSHSWLTFYPVMSGGNPFAREIRIQVNVQVPDATTAVRTRMRRSFL